MYQQQEGNRADCDIMKAFQWSLSLIHHCFHERDIAINKVKNLIVWCSEL